MRNLTINTMREKKLRQKILISFISSIKINIHTLKVESFIGLWNGFNKKGMRHNHTKVQTSIFLQHHSTWASFWRIYNTRYNVFMFYVLHNTYLLHVIRDEGILRIILSWHFQSNEYNKWIYFKNKMFIFNKYETNN